MSSVKYKIMMLGDFNAKQSLWYSPDATSQNGHKLRLLTEEFNLTQPCSMATYVRKNTFPDSLLDLAFTNITEAVHTVSTLPPVMDPLPILFHSYYSNHLHQK